MSTQTNVVPLKSGGQIAGIVPQSFEDVYRLSRCIAESGLAPHGMNTPEQVTVAIMTGLEIGLPPMFAIQKIAVINGRPALWGNALPALLWARGFRLKEWIEGSGDDRVAFCEITRPDGEKITRKFSVSDAKRAGLWQTQEKVKRRGKDGGWYEKDNDSPWFRFPDRMLQMRARGFSANDGAADVMSGLYLAEELQEPMRDITPASAPVLEIPDIPDEPETADTPMPEPEAEPDDVLADPDGFLERLAEQIELCGDQDDLNEVAESNEDMIKRLPKEHRIKAAKMIAEAAE